ncbi:MAG TPA: S8 family serine peptidase [Streptosporangiaceae bacterium]|nr:S8 family serine peptidase [Streptosporangiaceae bacterium]
MPGVTPTEGKDGVSLRFARPAVATAAIGLAFAWTALGSVPALADQARQQEWWLAKLHVTQAWQTTRGAGVTVALLDTGVDLGQADLSGSVIAGQDFTNSHEQQGGQFFGIHGSAMASLIVGHGHGPGNGAGIVGVAPDARLLSVRVTLDGSDPLLFDSAITSALPDEIAAGIRYAVSNGAQVIDLPLDPGQTPSVLVAPPTSTTPAPSPSPSRAAAPPPDGTPAERAAVAYALSQGVVLVAPAGDNGNRTDAPNFPAAYPGVISVGAFDGNVIKAPFSSRQPYVTLTAAGAGLIAEVPPNTYAPVSSTSAASAVVTGIVALIKSKFPELTPAQVTRALIRGAAIKPPGGTADGSGHGTVDAARALAAAAAIAAPGLHRAGDRAVSSGQLPAAPSASPLAGENLRPKLERDAVISLAVLVVLLLPITVYWGLKRRRKRARALARAEHEHAAQASFAQNGDGTADMMREYFATLPGQPGHGGSRSAAGPSGPMATALGGSLADEARRTGFQIPRSPLTPITRAGPQRPPRVSGAPPWEPAPKPAGELPWTNSPAPATLSRRGTHAAPPTSSVWAAATPGAQGPGAAGDGADESGAEEEAGGRPIYVWNPTATTDTFPQVPSDGRDQGS